MSALPLCCQSAMSTILPVVSCRLQGRQHLKQPYPGALQAAMGRKSGGIRYGPRPLDLDIIFYGDQRIAHERLQVPHPRWQERPFVQVNLASPE